MLRAAFLWLGFLGGFLLLSAPNRASAASTDEDRMLSAKQLVVMLDGRFPTTGALTSGAGIVVGKKGGLVYIATAGHVVHGLYETATQLRVQFLDRPGDEIDATVWPTNFDKGIDLAILVVPEGRVPETITELDALPAARISDEIAEGEGAYLFGQPQGRMWSGNTTPERVVETSTTSIEIGSDSVVPGMSGGAAMDEGHRLVGLIVDTQNGNAHAISIRYLGEILESSGFPFDLINAEGFIPALLQGNGSEKERLSTALLSGTYEELSRFPRDKKTAALTQTILESDETVRRQFFSQTKSDKSISWFIEIIKSGLDPNFLVTRGENGSALTFALERSNIPLAIALLEHGASPHARQRLRRGDPDPDYLYPLDWLTKISASENEKRNLAESMVRAGLAVFVRSPNGDYAFHDRDVEELQEVLQTLEFLGLQSSDVDALRRDQIRCEFASRQSDVDWCAEMDRVPDFLEDITGYGESFDKGFLIGKLIGVYENKMHFLAVGSHGRWEQFPISLAIFTRGRDRVEIFRYGGYYKNNAWSKIVLDRPLGAPGYDHYGGQSIYCRRGTAEDGYIREIKYPGRNWSEVPLTTRMEGRVPC